MDIKTYVRYDIKLLTPFYYTDECCTKLQYMPSLLRGEFNLGIAAIEDQRAKQIIILRKGNSTPFMFEIFRWHGHKAIKKCVLSMMDNAQPNQQAVLHFSSADNSLFVFYHESTKIFEVRNSFSLKTYKSFNLQSICDALSLSKMNQGVFSCIDGVYIAKISSVFLCIGGLIVLAETENNPRIIFSAQQQCLRDRFLSASCHFGSETILVEGKTCLLLFSGFKAGEEGFASRIIKHQPMTNDSRLLGWSPKDQLAFLAKRTISEKETIYIMSYKRDVLRIVAAIVDKRPWSTFYCAHKNELLYLDLDFSGRSLIKHVQVDKLDEEVDISNEDDEEQVFEGSYLADLPSGIMENFIWVTLTYFSNALAVYSLKD